MFNTTAPFLWGTAVSGHQVEGQNTASDWWHFESHPSADAADFRNRFDKDLQLAASLGTNAFRFSIEWARIEPSPGQVDAAALQFYDDLINSCLQHGLTPLVTLVHFTLPQWCRTGANQGWLSPAVRDAFEAHVERVAERYLDRVSTWMTVNEPSVYAYAAYVGGVFPPGQRGRFLRADRAHRGLLDAHIRASTVLRRAANRRGLPVHVGLAHQQVDWQSTRHPLRHAAHIFNWRFLEAIYDGRWGQKRVPAAQHTTDFLGIIGFFIMPTTVYVK